jgi:hypothetical protein
MSKGETKWGILLGPSAGDTPGAPAERSTGGTNAAAHRLRRDLAEGRFRTRQVLPSCKELSELYGICFSTLKRLLTAMVDEGILIRHKKQYRIRHLPSRRSGSRVLLILSQDLFDLIEMQGTLRTWVYPLINAMENECSRRNLRFVLQGFSGDAGPFRKSEGLLGTAIWLAPDYPKPADLIALAETLLSAKRPVFLFDGDQQGVFQDYQRRKNLYFWADLGFASGYEAGQFLLARGHRKICFFAHSPAMQWSEDHLRGLIAAFASIGISDAITPLYALDSPASPHRY